MNYPFNKLVYFSKDRLAKDQKYLLNSKKAQKYLSWKNLTTLDKGLDETIGAIPLGLVLCILTLASGTIWIALFVHVAMAWTNCFTALKFHPDIHYQPKR